MKPLKKHTLQGGQTIFLGAGLTDKEAKDILSVIRSNTDVFAYKHNDMVRVDPCIAQHHLRTHEECCLMKQKLHCFHPERHTIIKSEVENLLVAGFI